jgi:hypothetical protein
MDEEVLEQLLRARNISAEDLLRQTAAERVDGVVEILMRHLPYDEVRRAFHERIGGAPRAEYMILRAAYFKHCDDPPAIKRAKAELAAPGGNGHRISRQGVASR